MTRPSRATRGGRIGGGHKSTPMAWIVRQSRRSGPPSWRPRPSASRCNPGQRWPNAGWCRCRPRGRPLATIRSIKPMHQGGPARLSSTRGSTAPRSAGTPPCGSEYLLRSSRPPPLPISRAHMPGTTAASTPIQCGHCPDPGYVDRPAVTGDPTIGHCVRGNGRRRHRARRSPAPGPLAPIG